MMLTVNSSGNLCVNSAALDDMDSFVDFVIKAEDLIGTIVFEDKGITFNMN